jgi:hypothetical protein
MSEVSLYAPFRGQPRLQSFLEFDNSHPIVGLFKTLERSSGGSVF